MQKYTKKSNYCNNQKKDVSLHCNSQGLHRVQIALRQYFESDVSLRFPLQIRGGRKGNRVQIASCRATVNRRYHGMAEYAIGPLQVREGATPETKARRPAAMSIFPTMLSRQRRLSTTAPPWTVLLLSLCRIAHCQPDTMTKKIIEQ